MCRRGAVKRSSILAGFVGLSFLFRYDGAEFVETREVEPE